MEILSHRSVISHVQDVIGLLVRPIYAPSHFSSTKHIFVTINLSYYLSKMFYFILYLSLQVVLFAAWVSGALDDYQKMFQEMILDAMGETKVSYALKSEIAIHTTC